MNREWNVVPHAAYPGMLVIEGPESSITVVTDALDIDLDSHRRRIGDAHIIAAAPAMLEALENLENDAGQIPQHAWKMVKDAITKAKGDCYGI